MLIRPTAWSEHQKCAKSPVHDESDRLDLANVLTWEHM